MDFEKDTHESVTSAIDHSRPKELAEYLSAKDADGNTRLHHFAKKEGAEETVLVLILAGANVNEENNAKELPIHLAVNFGRFKSMEHLEQAGSDLGHADCIGYTPLKLALRTNQHSMATYLENAIFSLLKEAKEKGGFAFPNRLKGQILPNSSSATAKQTSR
jgi:ankyrin repeat protein